MYVDGGRPIHLKRTPLELPLRVRTGILETGPWPGQPTRKTAHVGGTEQHSIREGDGLHLCARVLVHQCVHRLVLFA